MISVYEVVGVPGATSGCIHHPGGNLQLLVASRLWKVCDRRGARGGRAEDESGAMAGEEEGRQRLMPCARAKYSFQAKNELELSFSAGVSVRLLRRIDDNWLEGELDGKVGIFPASFVEIELGIPSKAKERELARSGRPYAIGLFDFPGDCRGDLPFAKGELIELLGSAGSGWMKGKTGGQVEGIFPASFVEIMRLPVSPDGLANRTVSGVDRDIGNGGGDCGRSSPPSNSAEQIVARDSPRSSSRTDIVGGARNSPRSLSRVDLVGTSTESPRSRSRGNYNTTAVTDSPRFSSRTDLEGSVAEALGTRYSPEYAEPFQTPPTSRAACGPAPSARDRGSSVGEEGVFQNGLSDEERRGEEEEGEEDEVEEEIQSPVPTPRRRKSGKSVSATVLPSERERERGGEVGKTTPSRTPPMSPRNPGVVSPPARRQILSGSPISSRSSPRTRRTSSLTDLQRELNSLQASLTIEKKLLVSARTLLDVTEDEGKREKLRTAITIHQENAESIRQQLSQLKGMRETLAKDTEPPARPSSPPQQSLPPPKPLSLDQQRAKVVEELVTTETDYHNQMQACCDKLIPAMEQIGEVNCEVLFGNLREVTLVSRDLATALQETCRGGGGGGDDRVGEVFVRFGPRLRSAYATYCRNHDNASSLVEKYAENGELMKKIRTALDAIRLVTQAWDLQSLLIKPVQRVLKYPLLLGKLVQTTTESHPDYRLLHRAREVVGHVAQDINEIKRRKDLVERYTGPERRGTMSVHSLQKKVRRLQQSFTQFTGLRTKTVDPEFEELEQKLTSLEMFLRQLIRNVTSWQEELQKVLDSQELMGEGMVLYVPSDLRPLTCYQRSLVELQRTVKTHGVSVTTHVLTPFQSLLSLFQDPLHLITKRRDKLLDFDHLQYVLDHNTEDPEKIKQLRDACTMAKRNYEALNQQLIEELPRFIHLAQNIINHTVTVLFQLQFRFHSITQTILRQLAEQYGPRDIERPLSSESIQTTHTEALSEVAGRLISLSIVPASLTMSLPATIRGGGGGHRRTSDSSSVFSDGEREESILSTSSEVDVDSCISEEPPVVDTTTDPPLPPDQGSQLIVIYDFEAQDRAELTVSEGETVVLKCPHDRVGCSEWWLVESQNGTGYVPANFLHFHGNYNT